MSLFLLSNNVNGLTRPLRQRRVHLLAGGLIDINVKKQITSFISEQKTISKRKKTVISFF